MLIIMPVSGKKAYEGEENSLSILSLFHHHCETTEAFLEQEKV